MAIPFYATKPSLLRNLLKATLLTTLYNSNRTAVDLAHKIHGDPPSDKGLPIFVLHGLLGSKKNWETMSKKLNSATGHSVIAVDARNHGESPHVNSHTYLELAGDVSSLMGKLGAKEAMVVGHSMGGKTAMVLALNEPTKVKKLVVVDISPFSTVGSTSDFFPRLFEAMLTVKFEAKDTANARKEAKTKLKDSGTITDEAILNFIVMSIGRKYDNSIGWMCNAEALKNNFAEIRSWPKEMAGKKYSGPTLFIAGDQSNYVAQSDLERIKELFPLADLTFVNGVGHNVHAENPDAFFNLVNKFYSK